MFDLGAGQRRRAAVRCGRGSRLCLALATGAAEFEEGVDYVTLPVPVETGDPSKIEVVEVFSYACIHCYTLEPLVVGWLRTVPDDVDFRRCRWSRNG